MSQITWRDPLGTEREGWRAELLLPSVFLAAAAFILAVIDPVHVGFRPRLAETVIVAAAGAGLLGRGLARGRMRLYFAGAAVLLGSVAVCLATQPVPLGAPQITVWPLRVLLFALVAGAWVFLLGPPLWARRALLGLAAPAGLGLLCASVPYLASLVTARPLTPPNFPPQWLAIDSQDRLYASSATGNFIWVFDPSGAPLGTIWPRTAPAVGAPEAGIIPVGYQTPVVPPRLTPGTQPVQQFPFTICGLAIDPQDRLYVVDPINRVLLRFDRHGRRLDEWPLPPNFDGARGCLAANERHVYLSSRLGIVYFLDYGGRVVRQVQVPNLPFGLSSDGKGGLIVLGPGRLDRVNVATGDVQELAYPEPDTQLRIPYQSLLALRNGDLLLADTANSKVLRVGPDGGMALGTIGGPGFWPGQFQGGVAQGLAGLAEDSQGRIYVADWQVMAIQRFTPDGSLDMVLSAPAEKAPPPVGEEGE